jgi:hypothetical protein
LVATFPQTAAEWSDGALQRRQLHVGPQKAQIELDGIEGLGPHA